jgi:ABC-type multidrug transport system permease subunit
MRRTGARGIGAAALWAGLFVKLSSREFQIAALFACFPALLALVYAQSFGASGFTKSLGAIVVLASDEAGGGAGARRFEDALRAQRFEGEKAMSIYKSKDLDASMRALRDGHVAIVIDASQRPGEDGATTARVYADPSSGLAPYAESFARAAAASENAPIAWRTAAIFTGGSGGANDFLVVVPGLYIFGWIFGVMTTALILVRETRRRTIDRSRLAGASVVGLVAGLWAAQCVLGLFQAVLLWAAVARGGFPTPPRPFDAALAILFLDLLMAALAASCGLATAAFSDGEGTAVNLSMVFIAPLAFLSGAVFPLPIKTLFSLGGYGVSATDLLPSGPATQALTDVMLRGAGIGTVWPALLVSMIGTAAYAIAGGAIFKARRLGT